MTVSVGGTSFNAQRSLGPDSLKDFPDLNYEYPYDLKLKPGTDLHDKILSYIKSKAQSSRSAYTRKFDEWIKTDNTLNAFIDLADWEKEIKQKSPNTPVSIVLPYSFAILETMISYMMSAFLQDPIFMFEGVSPEDTVSAILMEKIIQQHCVKNKVGLALHTLIRNGFAYNLGIGLPLWNVKYGKKRVKKVEYNRDLFGRVISSNDIISTEEGILFEGNDLVSIDPYLFFPDSSTPIHDIQRCECFGWLRHDSLLNMLANESEDEFSFNAKYLKSLTNRRCSLLTSGMDKGVKRDFNERYSFDNNTVDNLYWYQNLIPFFWGLGKSTQPEKWLFVVSADSIITHAERVDLDHGDYPVVVNTPDFDGHSLLSTSRMTLLSGLQEVLNWMFNMHVSNVRRGVNNSFVVDPYQVNINDIINPRSTGGGLIRLRRTAWGRGVAGVIEQLPINDVTRQHMADSVYITDAMEKAAGTSGYSMGVLRHGGPERLTGTEFEGSQQGLYTRLERAGKVMSMQLFRDLGRFFAFHTQQLMTQETYIKTTGRWQDVLAKEYNGAEKITISPFDILCDYDLSVRDGTMPSSQGSKIWLQLLDMIANNQELAGNFDLVRIVSHIMRNAGAKNVDSFIKVKIAPDEQVMNAADQGNMVNFDQLYNISNGVNNGI